MPRFEDKLVLSRWMLEQFGAETLSTFQDVLSDPNLIGVDEENTTLFHYELVNKPFKPRAMSDDVLRLYDENIVRHWKQITEKRNHSGNTLYPLYFQYLSLLFTEHYLDRYFTDKSALCDDLNTFTELFNQDLLERERVELFKESDLNKLAVWIATGGGKTLIMHVNALQFQHYLRKAKRDRDFNRTILLTPNQGLSLQHKEELDQSNIEADLFVKEGGSLFKGAAIEIIDIHKLKAKTGEKTIAVESFESNNLVLVDEGHRGAGGVDWMSKRNQLCENGFSFEYSATFGQAIKASSGSPLAPTGTRAPSAAYRLTQQYSRCILFDYSYKFFHGDGYGKDHYILNLSHVWTHEQTQLYLTGCILAFYQQKRLFQDKHKSIAEYLLADPLWIFVGGKVTAKGEFTTNEAKQTVSDIQAILHFLSRFVGNKNGESVRFIEQLLTQQDDLVDQNGKLIFGKAFPYVQSQWASDKANELFHDVLSKVFHASGSGTLHVVHLKGSGGEIAIRVGENDWFGLINVGDASKLIKLCEEDADDNMVVTDQSFSASLFQGINKKDSSINLLIGAKKFTEGWSSWRVSTMGLMNVGRSEGSEIIQLFGRGVRLKGYDFTLKRSNHIPGIKHPENITLLETLNVFGIRSEYMQEFEECLEEEGVGEETTELVVLPVIKRLERDDLKLIRLNQDIPPFKQAQKPWLEPPPAEMSGRVTINWYPKIQAKRSKGVSTSTADNQLNEGVLESRHLAFMDLEAIYFEIAQYKNEKAWYNLQLDRKTISALLTDSSWYRLYIPQELLEVYDFERVFIWQEIAVALLKKYAERYYNFRKNEYEGPHLEYYEVRETDDNFINEYKASIDRTEQQWIDRLNELKGKLEDKTFKDSWSFGKFKAFDFSKHMYQPLIYFSNNEIVKVSPVPLNTGEHDFVEDLKEFYLKNSDYFSDKELYLLRNQSKGKGVGFFEAGNFFPDFILWIIHDGKQYVSFIDPKGLTRVHGFDDPKIKFHKTIKEMEKRPGLNDPNIVLNSFIVSNTYQENISWWSKGSAPEQDFDNSHVLFQKDDKNSYISKIIKMIVMENL
jgi:hypothetical protein